MAFPVIETTAESITATASTNHVIVLPTGITAGDLILFCTAKGTPATTTTFNTHADYAELIDENIACGLTVHYRYADGSETNPSMVTALAVRRATIAYRISGAADPAITPPTIGSVAAATSTTPDPAASATPPASNDYLFIALAGLASGEELDDDTWGNTSPTNYLPSPPLQKACGTAGTNLAGAIMAASRSLTTGSAQDPGTFSWDVSNGYRAATITIHPAPPVVPPPPPVIANRAPARASYW